jgi:hypothetical protein
MQRITEVENIVGVVSEHSNLNQLGNMVAYVNVFNALLLDLLTSYFTLCFEIYRGERHPFLKDNAVNSNLAWEVAVQPVNIISKK